MALTRAETASTIARRQRDVPAGALTPLDFSGRFSFEQLVAIEVAAETAAPVRVAKELMMSARYIVPEDPRTAALLDVVIAAIPDAFGADAGERQAERARLLAPVA